MRLAKRSASVALLVGLCLGGASLLRAQDYPNKPVRIVVPFAPGGATDVLARLVGEKLSASLGQQFVIDNKPGAGGNIGTGLVAKAEPDGYTLLMGTVGTHAINASIYPSLPYDPVKDFAPVTLVATVPNVLVVNPEVRGQLGGGAHRACQGPARRAQFRLFRQRQLDPSFGRALQG